MKCVRMQNEIIRIALSALVLFQPHTIITHKKPTVQSEMQSKVIPSGARGNAIVFSRCYHERSFECSTAPLLPISLFH